MKKKEKISALVSFFKWFSIYLVIHTLLFLLQKDKILQKTPHPYSLTDAYFYILAKFEIIALLCTYTYYRISPFFQDKSFIFLYIMLIPYILLAMISGNVISMIVLDKLVFKWTFATSLNNFQDSFFPSVIVTFVLTLFFSRTAFLEYKVKIGEKKRGKEDLNSTLNSNTQLNKNKTSRYGLSVKEKENWIIIPYGNIIFISAHQKKSVIHCKDRDYETLKLLKELESKLPEDSFLRIHKSFIVKLSLVSHIQYFLGGSYLAFLKDEDETNLPVGRMYAPELKLKLKI